MRKVSRFAAITAAVALLTGGILAGGTLSANADNGLEFTTTTVTWTGTPFAVSGMADGANTGGVEIHLGADETGGLLCSVVYSDPWTCNLSFAPGTYTITAYQAPGLGVARTDTEVLTVVPPQPTYTSGDPYNVTSGDTATFSGVTTAPDATVWVDVPSVGSCTIGPFPTPGTAWSCGFPVSAAPGDWAGAYYQVSGGVESTHGSFTFHVDAPPASAVQWDPSFDGAAFTWAASPPNQFSGTTTDLNYTDQVEVYDGATLLCTDFSSFVSDGTWFCEPATALDPGSYSLTVVQAGESDVTNFEVHIPAPQVDQAALVIAPGDDADYTGTTTYPDVQVEVYVSQGGAFVQSCVTTDPIAAPGDPWECPILGLPTGHYDVGISQIVGGTAHGDGIVDTLDVGVPFAVTSPVAEDVLIANTDDSLTITGTATPSTTVDVHYDGEGTACSNVAVGADGTWTCLGTIPPGPHSVFVYDGVTASPNVFFEIILPAPVLSGPGTFTAGSGVTPFTGATTYPGASTRVTLYQNGDGLGPEVATAECPDDAGTFSCDVDLTGLTDDNYVVRVEHFLPEDDGVGSNYSESYIGLDPGTLTCSYGPASATITGGPSIYLLTPWAGQDEGGPYYLAPNIPCGGNSGNTFPAGTGFYDQFLARCSTTCALTGLAPGAYEVYASLGDESSYDYVFTVPNTPSIGTAVSTGSTVAMRGSGTAGDRIRVVNNASSQLCSTTVALSGAWACSFTSTSSVVARALDIDAASGAISAYSASKSITIVGPASVVTPNVLEEWLLTFDGDLSKLKPGDHFSITLAGIPAGWTVQLIMHSDPYLLGSAVATGAPMTLDLVVPKNIDGGKHTLQVVATTPLGTNYFKNLDATVIATDATDGATPAPTDPGDDSGSGNQNSGGDRSQPGGASALTGSIATIADIARNPITVAFASILALALLLLVALPTELLNSSLESNSSRLGRGYSAIDRALKRAQAWFIKTTRSPALAAAIIVTVISIVYGFIDPRFGFDLVSLRLVLSLAIAFFILSYGASWLASLIVRRFWGAIPVIQLQPTIILFAIVGVIVARILEFSPGFLIGIAIGLEVLNASRKIAARAVMVQLGVIAALSLIAWIIYSLFTPGND
ncbi:MAG: hypothetical protein ABI435_05090, partial [Pseudolysinimonas sp.]